MQTAAVGLHCAWSWSSVGVPQPMLPTAHPHLPSPTYFPVQGRERCSWGESSAFLGPHAAPKAGGSTQVPQGCWGQKGLWPEPCPCCHQQKLHASFLLSRQPLGIKSCRTQQPRSLGMAELDVAPEEPAGAIAAPQSEHKAALLLGPAWASDLQIRVCSSFSSSSVCTGPGTAWTWQRPTT